MNTSQTFYIIKFKNDGQCQIVSSEQFKNQQDLEIKEKWGPFNSQQEAIAKRVGLIRTRKCQPA